jgi:hypothetical protein
MRWVKGVAVLGAGIGLILALGAAQHPSALATLSPGMWEIGGIPGARTPLHECFSDVMALAQFEHRHRNCTRNVVSDSGNTTVIHYSCSGGDFGDSRLTVITPRSMRIETQGISQQLPFNYVLQARRIGECASASSH